LENIATFLSFNEIYNLKNSCQLFRHLFPLTWKAWKGRLNIKDFRHVYVLVENGVWKLFSIHSLCFDKYGLDIYGGDLIFDNYYTSIAEFHQKVKNSIHYPFLETETDDMYIFQLGLPARFMDFPPPTDTPIDIMDEAGVWYEGIYEGGENHTARFLSWGPYYNIQLQPDIPNFAPKGTFVLPWRNCLKVGQRIEYKIDLKWYEGYIQSISDNNKDLILEIPFEQETLFINTHNEHWNLSNGIHTFQRKKYVKTHYVLNPRFFTTSTTTYPPLYLKIQRMERTQSAHNIHTLCLGF